MPPPAPPPATAPSPAPHGGSFWSRHKVKIGVAAAILAVVLTIILLIVFRRSISWTAWPYIIGVAAIPVLGFLTVAVVALLYDCVNVPVGAGGLFFIGAVAITKFVLFCVYRADYRVIFGFVSVLCLIAEGICAFIAFDEDGFGWGLALVAEIILCLLAFILGLIFL